MTGLLLVAALLGAPRQFYEVAQTTTPSNPSTGSGRLFLDSADGKWKALKSTGEVVNLEAAAGAGAPTDAEYVTFAASGTLSAERVATDTTSVDVDIGTAGQVKWIVLAAGVTLAGDVDGAGNALDLDEVAVETELEAVLDLDQMQGAVTDAQAPDTITVSLAATATALAANGGNCNAGSYPLGVDASGAVEGCTVAAGGGLVTNVLANNVNCAVSASYCTIWSHTPATASKGVFLVAHIIIDSNSATVAPQFRVSSADTGYTGTCYWQLPLAAGSTTVPTADNVAIGTGPADTADTAWTDAPRAVNVNCALLADASPGAILIEWQLETGTTPTQNVLAGSYMTSSN